MSNKKEPMDYDTGFYKICKILKEFTVDNQKKLVKNIKHYVYFKDIKKWLKV